ncbi:DSD1 family PLP-dependent enzyme [Pseudomonas thivervalensis]|uniref:Alanine racemase n=1 Tax=Pseudomonas thivervalensis TaxID=86265 RepID=A0A176NFF2_9PSED|nr:DSD1 family PLP-dependent enzyme [Pseudomonas thivervalensis]AXA53762.1 alanine racemase [Pseudomonas thivervalensis]AXA59350.1 alanine racemase [Pseudomonas thivervalensis]OAB49879.1 alanine racemase [Pseudomonas thivervalensis]SDF55167.1 D-serine deaminase, pyridoxal phosphate-dependent [Pseudomonas thivervalensis]
MSASIASLDTPAAIVDVPRMQHNIRRMQQRMDALGVRLRPHVKTSKCLPVIKAQLAAGACGVTVSTLKEAQYCFAEGICDVFYAVAIAPGKLTQALQLRRKGCQLSLLTDSLDAARAIVAFGQRHNERFDVWIEIDCDGHRSGLDLEDHSLLEVARVLSEGGMQLRGVMTHAGSSYELDTPEALQALAEQERNLCVNAAQRIRQAGFPCPEVSIGSTPTALSALNLEGVTEVRAGVYVFFDLVMHNVGICQAHELALSVLTTVIGHQKDKGWVITDAGWMAMSRDRGTQRQQRDFGYGQVCTETGDWIEGALLTGANQEHGIVALETAGGVDITARFPIGSRLRILPNHACATGAQFPDYHAVDAEGGVQLWSRLHGW